MNKCTACGATLKRGQSHCSQCGTKIEAATSDRPSLWKWGVPIALVVLIGVGAWIWSEWNEPLTSKEATTAKDVQQSFSASTEEEESEAAPEVEEEASLPDTDTETGVFYDPISYGDVDLFMYSFIDAFTSATYSKNTSEVESFLAEGSTFQAQTLDYLNNTLFAKGIEEDQLNTEVISIKVNGENRDSIEDDETATVTTNEEYRIIKDDSSVRATFETTYAVRYEDGKMKIVKNLGSKELSREEEY
ncbi:zinc ribbon domain-containing protein [Exiguobacterium sp. s57]|uniref:zinc ribbon domain-containing protein n=1 Tax=Exiguobacterium sp. s57 TaxID=2751258 RepID=UPI001BE7E940|nr:zinc ribbon domain-containing protein [Exiguobacterium sp. s57]